MAANTRDWDDRSEDGEIVEEEVFSMNLSDRDMFSDKAANHASRREQFALVTFSKGPAKHHVPAWFSNCQADYTPSASDDADRLAAPLSLPAFAPGSDGDRAKAVCMSAADIKIWVSLHNLDNKGAGEMREFARIINEVSHLSIKGTQRSDWYWTHHPRYKDADGEPEQMALWAPFDKQDSFPERQPWLQKESLTADDQYAPVWPADKLRTRHASCEAYTEVEVPALLFELEEQLRPFNEQFTDEAWYVAEFEPRNAVYLVKVKTSGDGVTSPHGKSQVLPSPGTRVTVLIKGLKDMDENMFIGHVARDAPPGFAFCFLSSRPSWLTHIAPSAQVSVRFDASDAQMKKCFSSVNSMRSERSILPDKSDSDGRVPFNIRNIVTGRDVKTLGPDYLAIWRRSIKPTLDVMDAARIEHEVTAALPSLLNIRQRRVYWLALRGCLASYLLLQGFPGTGKSSTFSHIIVAMVLLGRRVQICAQSNSGCDAVFEKVHKYASKWHPEWIEQGWFVRHEASTRRDQIFAQLQQGKKLSEVSSKVQAENLPFTVANLQHRYLVENPTSETATEYLSYKRAKDTVHAAYKPPGIKVEGSESVTQLYMEAVLKSKPRVLSVTAAASEDLVAMLKAHGSMQVDMLVFDEASQALESSLLVPLTNSRFGTVLIGGDQDQLPPFVQSQGKNPYALQLAQSPLERLAKAYPERPFVQLVTNYRGHPDTIPLPSAISYANKMVSGWTRDKYPSSDWARKLDTVFAGDFCGGLFKNKAGHRQWFVDYDGVCKVESGSTSAYNPNGVTAIVEFVSQLMKVDRASQDKICIISVYNNDRDKLSEGLTAAGFPDIECASVDSFQGRENRIVIVHHAAAWQPVKVKDTQSATRVNPIGFAGDKRRLNVALSRGQDFTFSFGNLTFWKSRLDITDKKMKQPFRLVNGQVPRWILPVSAPYAKMIRYVEENDEVVKWNGGVPAAVLKIGSTTADKAAKLSNEDAVDYTDEDWEEAMDMQESR